MKIKEVFGDDKDFAALCKKLEEFQFDLLPDLKEKGYTLTENLEKIQGFVLYLGEKPIGSVGFKIISDKNCEIVRVFVCEEHRGKGYAGLLFEKIEEKAKQLGFEKAEMVAWGKAESALRLYEKLGYKIDCRSNSEWFNGYEYFELSKKL